MALSKLEMQQMLREMNVKFSADETYEQLKQRLQEENHNRWLKSVADSRPTAGKPERVVVRKRKKEPQAQDPAPDSTTPPPKPLKESRPASRPTAAKPTHADRSYYRHPIEKPAPGKPWKEAANGTEPFNRKKKVFESVLRRSHACCESCGHPAEETSGRKNLAPFHILPLDQGGEHSIKNVVALCPACLAAVQNEPDPKMIKELKRKARAKLYDALEVIHKKKAGRRKR